MVRLLGDALRLRALVFWFVSDAGEVADGCQIGIPVPEDYADRRFGARCDHVVDRAATVSTICGVRESPKQVESARHGRLANLEPAEMFPNRVPVSIEFRPAWWACEHLERDRNTRRKLIPSESVGEKPRQVRVAPSARGDPDR